MSSNRPTIGAVSPSVEGMGGPQVLGGGGSAGSMVRGAGGSDISLMYGNRKMRAYPITEDELDRIADLGLYSTVCFSVAGACVGLAINFQKDQMLNTTMAPGVAETWEILKWLSVGVAVIAGIIGGVLTRRRRGQVQRIKQESSFA